MSLMRAEHYEHRFHPTPGLYLRNGHVQTVLASSGPRRALVRLGAAGTLRRSSEPFIVSTGVIDELGDHVRLEAWDGGAPTSRNDSATDLVVMIHGWEGNVDATYMLTVGGVLRKAGYRVVRLHLRDHGQTHHLNPGVFRSDRLDEIIGAVREISDQIEHRRLILIGFSLGGNFALRVGRWGPQHERQIRADAVVAVNPALDPAEVSGILDRGPWVYRAYFLRKWRASLRRKEQLFPDRYAFATLYKQKTITGLTAAFVDRYTKIASVDDYFDRYTLTRDRLAGLEIPTRIIASRDDPIIPAEPFEALRGLNQLSVEMHEYGGHCGFVAGPTRPSWLGHHLVGTLSSEPNSIAS